ncbi:glycosyltransferase [Flavobacterium sp. CYK-55]|uniref:glycosyltransferase n=1 Tax=Flavobacterium sp. CYK-55 TaxID=2835529 RepID=UPI001BCF92F4|nr:glycosyltransferase [Flavobacterium sp. CYK-55]MBS7786429.1 glycosyltransferase [Flavobacterium sp. CYK-55]
MENKRICLAIPSLNVGGMERVMIEIAQYIKKNSDHQVTIIKLARSQNNFYQVPEGVDLVEPDFFFNPRLRLYHSLKLLWFLIQTIRRIKPKSVLSFGEMYNSFVLLSSFFTSSKYYVSDRSQPDRKWGFFHEKMRQLVYRRAHGIVAQTSYSKAFFERELNHKNIRVIPNPGRDHDYQMTEKKNIVLYVGRLIPNKKVDLLLDIFDQIALPDWELWIVGDGPERQKLEQQHQQLKNQQHIKLWGAQKDIGAFYAQAKIFAFTSISEGFPNVLIEAQSYGVTCVSFDCVAGPSDIIGDGSNGFLIPLLNTEIFAQKLAELMKNDSLCMQMRKQSLIDSEKYKTDVVAEQFLNFITS